LVHARHPLATRYISHPLFSFILRTFLLHINNSILTRHSKSDRGPKKRTSLFRKAERKDWALPPLLLGCRDASLKLCAIGTATILTQCSTRPSLPKRKRQSSCKSSRSMVSPNDGPLLLSTFLVDRFYKSKTIGTTPRNETEGVWFRNAQARKQSRIKIKWMTAAIW
jgi:hypothetical protein